MQAQLPPSRSVRAQSMMRSRVAVAAHRVAGATTINNTAVLEKPTTCTAALHTLPRPAVKVRGPCALLEYSVCVLGLQKCSTVYLP